METSDNMPKETCIDDTISTSVEMESVPDVEPVVGEESPVEASLETDEIESVPVFAREDWHERVNNFEERYPIARALSKDIGDVLLEDEHLWEDESCLEKALLTVMTSRYMPDEAKARDEDFLRDYIYSNEEIRDKIIDEYVESIDAHRLPSMMTRGGRISLAERAKPRSIREAGAIAEKIMRR